MVGPINVPHLLRHLLHNQRLPPNLDLFTGVRVFGYIGISVGRVRPATEEQTMQTNAFQVYRVRHVGQIRAGGQPTAFYRVRRRHFRVTGVPGAPIFFQSRHVGLGTNAPRLLFVRRHLQFMATFQNSGRPTVHTLIILNGHRHIVAFQRLHQ